MPYMKLLVFAGSTRQHSFNRRLARVAADLARNAGADTTLLELSDFDIPMYNADLEARGTPADVVRLKQLLWEHPAWVICSPEYNGSYTALLKNTIDWASSPVKGDPVWQDGTRAFRGKVVGMLSASNGALGGLRSHWNAGWPRAPLPWARPPVPSTNTERWCRTRTASACRAWWNRCCGPHPACMRSTPEISGKNSLSS